MINKKTQSILEYMLIFGLLGTLVLGIVSNIKNIFKEHFNACKEKILSK
ncbi:MAG: hypothetical protein QXZ20_03495 [Candidatus Aenigmatarchaeota archaeon]